MWALLGVVARFIIFQCITIFPSRTAALTSISCGVTIVSKGYYYGNPTYVQILLNSVDQQVPNSNGINIYTLKSDCTVSPVLIGANFYVDSAGSRTAVINAINSIASGAYVIVAVRDTGPYMYSSSSDPNLYNAFASVGSTATSFPYRNSYALLGVKGGSKLCEKLPSPDILTCTYTLSFFVNDPTALPSSSPTTTSPSTNPSLSPTITPSLDPSIAPTLIPTQEPSNEVLCYLQQCPAGNNGNGLTSPGRRLHNTATTSHYSGHSSRHHSTPKKNSLGSQWLDGTTYRVINGTYKIDKMFKFNFTSNEEYLQNCRKKLND